MELRVGGKLRNLLSDHFEVSHLYTSVLDSSVSAWVFNVLPSFVFPLLNTELGGLGFNVSFFKIVISGFLNCIKFSRINALSNELSLVDILGGFHVLHDLVSQRRCERRVIKLIMS